LKFGQKKIYRPSAPLWKKWDFKHQPPGADRPLQQATNTMPDLATAMKYNPDLRIFLTAGYFDVATPFYEGWYEMHSCGSRTGSRIPSNIITISRATWSTPTRNRSRPCTMTPLHSSTRPIIWTKGHIRVSPNFLEQAPRAQPGSDVETFATRTQWPSRFSYVAIPA
jgi:hypothetical protein